MRTLSITVIQNSAGNDVDANVDRIIELAESGPAVDVIALPEVFAFRGDDHDYVDVACALPGPVVSRLQDLSVARSCWILAGSVIEQSGGSVYNTCLLVSPDGITASYRKIHLFEAHLEDGTVIRESDAYSEGKEPVSADIDEWTAGLSICYDLRFPELYRHYSRNGAHLFFIPSNFTQRTGKDHWATLVRARAIENQCFVVAPNQCGANPSTGVVSHGHSMIVGPWGEVLAEAGDQETVIHAELDPELLTATRERVPALKHGFRV